MTMNKLQNALDSIFSAGGVVAFMLLTGVAFTQVIARYVFGSTLRWPEEACRFSFIWMAYLGMVSCWRHDSHLRVDAVTSMVSQKTGSVLYVLNTIVSIAFCLFTTWCGYEMLGMVIESEQVALTLPLPLVYVWLAIPLCFFLSAVHALCNLLKLFTTNAD